MMLRIVSRNFWIVHLLFVACAAWLASQLCLVIIRDRVSAPPPAQAAKPAPKAQLAPEPYEKYAPVTELNIFNPAEKGAHLLPLEKKGPIAAADNGGSSSPPGSYILAGTVTGPQGHSWAILQEKTTKKQQVYRMHGDLEGGKILSVSRNLIEIERQGRKETLRLSPEVTPSKNPLPPSPIPQPQAGREEVKKLAANRFLVNREDVNAAVGDINKFITQARLKPHFEAGRPTGYSVSEVVPGSLMEKLGIRNNDVIKKVNGMSVSKPEDVMQAYAQLQRDSNIEVEVERGGRAEILRYEIR
ncbi:MAG TPA: type II secretion system protein GspC [Thermodesulfobacteriota bacterium]|nr:type II secretion system protein GspC [Thermodesulfobacteriota bacterium]